jgi:hypothetical protein
VLSWLLFASSPSFPSSNKSSPTGSCKHLLVVTFLSRTRAHNGKVYVLLGEFHFYSVSFSTFTDLPSRKEEKKSASKSCRAPSLLFTVDKIRRRLFCHILSCVTMVYLSTNVFHIARGALPQWLPAVITFAVGVSLGARSLSSKEQLWVYFSILFECQPVMVASEDR